MRFPTFCVRLSVVMLMTFCLDASLVQAYNPPTDHAGSLTVRIDAPEMIEEPSVPTSISVTLENESSVQLTGSLRLKLIDRWAATVVESAQSADELNFVVPANGSQTIQYTIVASEPTYNARYPIHAIATWCEPTAENGNASPEREYTAHPIAIVGVQQKNPPQIAALEIPWKPFDMTGVSQVSLTELPMVRIGFAQYGKSGNTSDTIQQLEWKPTSWLGDDPVHRGFVKRETAALDGGAFDCFVSHIPWTGGPGVSVVEIPVTLPANQTIEMTFANGIQKKHEGDGMTFALHVVPMDTENSLGETVWSEHQTTPGVWKKSNVDLSKFAGKTVRLQLEWNPGPKQNSSFDLGYWGQPVLRCGTLAAADDAAAVNGASVKGSAAREFTKNKSITVGPLTVTPGERGLLDAVYRLPAQNADEAIRFHGIQVKVLGTRLDRATSGIPLRNVVSEENTPQRLAYRHTFESLTDGTFDVVVSLKPMDGCVKMDVSMENAPAPQPWRVVRLEEVALGDWSDTVQYFYGGVGNIVKKPGSFRLGFDGHQLASSYVGLDFRDTLAKTTSDSFSSQAWSDEVWGPDPNAETNDATNDDAAATADSDVTDSATATESNVTSVVLGTQNIPDAFYSTPEQKHYSIHTASLDHVSFFVIPCQNVYDGVKVWRDVCGKGKSPNADKLAGKFVFDLWGGRYAETAEQLQKAFQYGLTDSVVVFHNWQRWGYDYRLPEIYPPNPQMGTLEEMQQLVQTCKDHGVLFAPHDNYVDIYPDADTFSYEKSVAFHPNGTPHEAWFNEGRGAQSYRYRADAISEIMRPNIEKIQENLQPTSYFIDVWSSLGAYDYWTNDGRFYDRSYTNQVWGDVFNHIRQTFAGNDGTQGELTDTGAPQISESGHDGLVGILDGAQTNHLRAEHPENAKGWSIWNIPHEDAERTPWLDAAYHDRFILHGAGYPGRYEGGLSAEEHGVWSDDYICTEILDGHPSMVSAPFNREVVRKYWLTAPIMKRLAGETIRSVDYVDGNIHHQLITWSNGTRVWVNRGDDDWTRLPMAEKGVLPPYGFIAVELNRTVAAIIRDPDTGLIFEYALDANSVESAGIYFNGRYPVGYQPIRCTVKELVFDGQNPRKFTGTLAWELTQPIPKDYRLFLHMVDPTAASEGIVFQLNGQQPTNVQKDSGEQKFETTFSGEFPAEVMAKLASGTTLELRGGLYRPQDGRRLDIVGTQDSGKRWRWVSFASDGKNVTQTPVEATPDRSLERLNPEKTYVRVFNLPVYTAYGYQMRLLDPSNPNAGISITPLPAPAGVTGVTFEGTVEDNDRFQAKKIVAIGFDGQEVATESSISEDGKTIHLIGTPDVFQFKLIR